MMWCCPACLHPFSAAPDSLECTGCGASYELVDGIPDLRHPPCADDQNKADLEFARRLAVNARLKSVEELIHEFFAAREGKEGWTRRDTTSRVRGTLVAPRSLENEIKGWLDAATSRGKFLDLGCGLGGLLSVAAKAGKDGVGIDNRMSVLVIAKRLIERNGGTPVLACANAEALPLPDDSVEGVVMYDVVEHIKRVTTALTEVDRVTKPGGAFACSTPNRFSLAPEPHVHIWGVGWLPAKYQNRYVRARSGKSYSGTRLLSPNELESILKGHTRFKVRLSVPPIPDVGMASGGKTRHALSIAYNALAGKQVLRSFMLRFCAFFQVVGEKSAA